MAVYKDKKRGTWYASFHYDDWTGKQCRKLKRGFATKKEASDWEKRFLLIEAASMDMKFKDFVKTYEADVKPKIKENTWITKEHIIRTKLMPYFKDKKMVDIKPRDIITWQNRMIAGKGEGDVSYAPTYLKTLQAQLSCMFNHAIRLYELPSNPVRKAGPMGVNYTEEMLFWTKEEYMTFIPCMANKAYSYYGFELLYWCGIRMGELRALTVSDFDFKKGTVSITKSYQRIKGKDVITTPKTKKSIRVIHMPQMLVDEMQDYTNSIYGLKNDERLFPISKSYLHHEMNRGVKASGVKRIRIHDLRHSHECRSLEYL
ncbi:MAG: site-specific integrase [Eubacteriales bacterium]